MVDLGSFAWSKEDKEILALIGGGYENKDIALKVHRSLANLSTRITKLKKIIELKVGRPIGNRAFVILCHYYTKLESDSPISTLLRDTNS